MGYAIQWDKHFVFRKETRMTKVISDATGLVNRDTDRETDRLTDGAAGRQREREAVRETDRLTDGEAEREKERQSERLTY